MTALDTQLVPEVLALINEFGKSVVVTVHGVSVNNPTTGKVVSSGTKEYTVKATPPENYSTHLIDGDLIQANDSQTIIAASGLLFTPETGLKITFDSEVWRVITVGKLYTGDSIAAYTLQLRK